MDDTTKNNPLLGKVRMSMTDKAPKQRDLDHLMEQNATELEFLSAYGGTSIEGDGGPLLAALTRFLKAGNVEVESPSETEIAFAYGTAIVVENGCKVVFEGSGLPLVASDVQQAGFAHGLLSEDRTRCEVILIEWGYDQRRFIERMSEHFSRVE
jgi:hypothetical protein|tara:strand:+ start:6396 stop:6857 length:462 start_codon:yes stop_codon:yes gene_type:complete